MTESRHFFKDLVESIGGLVKFGDHSKVPIHGRGNIDVKCRDGSLLSLQKALYIPKLKLNILSLGQQDDEGFKTITGSGWLSLYDPNGKLLVKVRKGHGRLYPVKLNISGRCMVATEGPDETWMWHKRYGHLNF